MSRLVEIPEGVSGERIDVALTRVIGLSRSQAAAILQAGGVISGSKVLSKGDRVIGGQVVEVDLEAAPGPEPVEIFAEPVPGMEIVYDDNDIVVVDKPPGVAAHPSRGWDGPTVIGGLAAAGFAISTSGAPEREGIVHRLDAGTSGLMMVA